MFSQQFKTLPSLASCIVLKLSSHIIFIFSVVPIIHSGWIFTRPGKTTWMHFPGDPRAKAWSELFSLLISQSACESLLMIVLVINHLSLQWH